MERFDKFIDIIFRNEGYDSIVYDTGGKTKWGISENSYPNIDIENLSQDNAELIYYRDYYIKTDIYKIDNNELCLQVVDFAINAGQAVSIRKLQKVCNDLNRYIKVDGVIGPNTLNAVNTYHAPKRMVQMFKEARFDYYFILGKQKEYREYLKGWVKRIFRTYL